MLSTGIDGLDFITGGGLPRGKITEFFGEESTGKTSVAMKIASSMDMVVYFDLEDSISVTYKKENMIYDDNFYLAKNIEDYYILPLLDQMMDARPDMLVIDSLAFFSYRKLEELFGRIEENLIGSSTAVLLLNQTRNNIGSFGFHSYGMDSIKKRCAMRVKLKKSGNIRKDGITTGTNINFQVIKNRKAPPFKDIVLPLEFRKGF